MIAQSAEWADVNDHIRPFQLHRDLADLATLIEAAFGDELQHARSTIVRDMRQMALMGPLVLAAGSLVVPIAGFVWIEDGRLVGNVSYSPEPGGVSACSVSNVAVLPAYRRRGIARRLLAVTLDHLRRQGCRRVFLEVRADNEGAIALYREYGFAAYAALHEQFLLGSSWPLVIGDLAPGLRRVRASDGSELFRLHLASTLRTMLHARPPSVERYQRGLRWRLERLGRYLASGERREEWVGEENRRIVAYGALTTYLSPRPGELELMVAPERRGLWEHPLIDALFSRASSAGRGDVRAMTPASHPQALAALTAVGFRTTRVLDQMMLELDAPRPAAATRQSQE